MTVMSWLRLTISLWLLRMAVKAAGWVLLVAVAVALWPVTLVTAAGYTAASQRGWPPSRLRHAAAASVIVTAVYTAADVIGQHAGRAAALAPVHAWTHGWHRDAVAVAGMFVAVAPVAVPAGLLLAAGLWAWRNYAVEAGIGGWMASAPVTFEQPAVEDGRSAPPRAAPPPPARSRCCPGGAASRSAARSARWPAAATPVFAVPAEACARHMVIVGATGTGKTNLMIRLWAGWFTAALDAFYAGKGNRPLLIVLDCKGGQDARKKAARTRRLMYGAGASHVAIWPDQARITLWDLPPGDLAVLLYQMIETGTGERCLLRRYLVRGHRPGRHRAGRAPVQRRQLPGPPGHRLAPRRLGRRHPPRRSRPGQGCRRAPARHPAPLRHAAGPARPLPSTGPARWPTPTSGTSSWKAPANRRSPKPRPWPSPNWPPAPPPARHGERRAILLAADDYSAVSRRVPLSNLYERGRSLGIGVQVSAQSWQGLGRDEDERYRIAATADGGVFVMHTPYPEPLCQLAGARRVLETAHKLIGNAWGDEGTTRLQHAWTADPDLIRRLRTGQACYISHGTATFVQVARPRPSPLTILPPPALPDPPVARSAR